MTWERSVIRSTILERVINVRYKPRSLICSCFHTQHVNLLHQFYHSYQYYLWPTTTGSQHCDNQKTVSCSRSHWWTASPCVSASPCWAESPGWSATPWSPPSSSARVSRLSRLWSPWSSIPSSPQYSDFQSHSVESKIFVVILWSCFKLWWLTLLTKVPMSDILEVDFLKMWRCVLVRMMNLSFHLENIFSCCTHITPFLTQLSLPSTLLSDTPGLEMDWSLTTLVSVLSTPLILPTMFWCLTWWCCCWCWTWWCCWWCWTGRHRLKSRSVTALAPSPSGLEWWPGAGAAWWGPRPALCWVMMDECGWETARGILKHVYVITPGTSMNHAPIIRSRTCTHLHYHHLYVAVVQIVQHCSKETMRMLFKHAASPGQPRWMKLQIFLITSLSVGSLFFYHPDK